MDRPAEWSGEIKRSYDDLSGWRNTQIGIGFAITDLLGGYIAITALSPGQVGSFGASPLLVLDSTGVRVGITTGLTGSATYSLKALVNGGAVDHVGTTSAWKLNLGVIEAFVFSESDRVGNIYNNGGSSTGYGDIAADTNVICHQCLLGETAQLQITSAAPTGGNVNWYLITVTPQQEDTTLSTDPNYSASAGTVADSAILPYYNSANPTQPLAGPGGTNPPTSQQSLRQTSGTVNVIGPQTNTSTTVPPAALQVPSTDIGLYILYVNTGDTQLETAQIWPIGLGTAPALTGGYVAPFLRGLTQQHHLGVPGGAPQIDGGVEWKPLSAVNNNGQALVNLSALGTNGSPVGNIYGNDVYAESQLQLDGGGLLVLAAGATSEINGISNAGGFPVQFTAAGAGLKTSPSNPTTLASITPSADGMWRVDVYMSGNGSPISSPQVTVSYKDASGSTVGSGIAITLSTLMASGGDYIYAASFPVFAKSGTALTVATDAGSIPYAIATLTPLY